MMAWIWPLSRERLSPLRISRPSTSTLRSSICRSLSLTSATTPHSLRAHLDHPVLDLDLVRSDRLGRRKDPNLARHNVEPRTVQWAFHFAVLRIELALGQFRLFVRAVVVDRVHVVSHPVQPDGLAVGDHLLHATVRDLVEPH